MTDVPKCYCENESMQECKWEFNTVLSYHHPERPETFRVELPFKMENIPQPLAQIAMQLSVAALNKMHAHLTVEWQKLCREGVSEEELVNRLMTMVEGD